MADIFISFKTDDTPRVQAIYDGFRVRGLTVFWSNDIAKGVRNYQDIIKDEILKAPVVVVAWTNGSVYSGPVVQECSQAEKANKLFQILLDDIEPIDMPMEVQYKAQKTVLLGWTGDLRHPEWAKLNAAIDARLGGKPAAVSAERDWERFGIGDSKNAEIIAAYIKQYQQSEPLWAAKAKERLAALQAELKRREDAARLAAQQAAERQRQEQEARYRAEGRIEIDAALVRNPHGRWFLPGEGKTEGFKDADFAPEMLVVPKGSFTMGSPENEEGREGYEGPQRPVSIAKPFAVGRYPVTVAEYMAGVKTGGCKPPEWLEKGSEYNIETGSDDHYKQLGEALTGGRNPIVGVSWEEAKAYAKWLSGKTGKRYGLLSEAQWEYACRAGSRGRFCFGDDERGLDAHAWYSANSGGKTHPVGEKLPNEWGLHDMHGNVWEWCEDIWHDNYKGAPQDGSAWTTGSSALRVLRGGSWLGSPRNLRAACRFRNADFRGSVAGFRLARTL